MNVVWQTFRSHLKSMTIWAVALAVLMIVSMAKYGTLTENGGAAIQTMLRSFPQSVQAIYGMTGVDMMSVAGYFSVVFLFAAITAAVHAGLLGAGLIADEERDKTTEFLYVKPRSRARIISAKLIAGLTNLIVVWAAVVTGSIVGIQKFARMDGFWHDFWLLMGALALIQLIFFALGALGSSIRRRAAFSGRLIAIVIFVSYLLYVFSKLSDSLSWLRFGSIFRYLDAADIVTAHTLNLLSVLIGIAIVLASLTATIFCYRRRDLSV